MSGKLVPYCARCGGYFKPGETRYRITIDVVADYDGHLRLPDAEADINDVFREVEDKTERELMDEIAKQLNFTLCKRCRDEWVKSPLGDFYAEAVPSAGQVH